MKINYIKSDSLQEQRQKLMNPDSTKEDKDINFKYDLVQDLSKSEEIGELNSYLPNFMLFLWRNPKIVCKLLLSANTKDIKDHLSNFFCNNFYENILSSKYIEHNLLYLIFFLLNEEINNINSKKQDDPIKCFDNFLNNSACSYILEQLHKKKDVQTFFKTLLINVVQDLELSSANKEIILDLKKIEQEIESKTKSRKGSMDNNRYTKSIFDSNLSIDMQVCTVNNEFFKLYISSFNNEYLKNLLSKNELNKPMTDYINFHITESEKKENLYLPEAFYKKNKDESLFEEIMNEYQKNFGTIINLINDLFKNLLNNLYLLPYSIKCICKMIFHLIKKKFNSFNIIQQYAFMSKFFFGKLFKPIFENPGLGALINTFIISTTTLKNLEMISKIILTFASGNLFKNNKEEENFTPFNSFFLRKMPNLVQFFEGILNVRLPDFIEQCINDKLLENFEYNYFKENPEEIVYHRSSCFTIDDLSIILEIMNKNKKFIFSDDSIPDIINLKKTFEKLYNKKCKETIEKIKNNPEYEIIEIPIYHKKKKEIKEVKKQKGRKIIKYFLISDTIFNEKYTKIYNIEQETKYFNLPELKNIGTKEEIMKNNIIKVKNFFSIILYNYRMLVKTDFEDKKIANTISILKELKKFMRSSNNIIGRDFPSQWFVNSLLDYLNKIPNELIQNDYEDLINEIKNDITQAIKDLNFEDLSALIDKTKFANRGRMYYENVKNLIIDINLNKKAQTIVEKEIIEVEILTKYSDKTKVLTIEPPNKNEKHLNYLDSIFEEPKKKPSKLCNTIKMFTKYFPNLTRYQDYFHINILTIEAELDVPKKIEKYFKIVREHIRNNLNLKSDQEFSSINDKIYDYVMEKLYEKLYPKTLNEIDKKIYQNCEKLSWVEPKHFIKGNDNYIYESFLPDLSSYLLRMTKEKSIRKKFMNMKEIFECMDKLGEFNGKKEFNIDEQMTILRYVFIKSKPKNIYEDLEFLELFIGNKKDDIEGHNLAKLKVLCQYIANLSSSELNGVGEKEFNDNCSKINSRTESTFDLESVI